MAHPAYRAAHQAIRAQLIAILGQLGAWPCPRCGQPMSPGMVLDLGHSDPLAKAAGLPGDRLEHSKCNRRDGQRLGAASRQASRASKPMRRRRRPRRTPREWLRRGRRRTGRRRARNHPAIPQRMVSRRQQDSAAHDPPSPGR